MAKGNDGHVLQHGVECALAELLTRGSDPPLFVSLTHGMRPFERFPAKRSGATRLADAALVWASKPGADGDPALIRAYRATQASPQHYPNTVELLAALIGKGRVVGRISEVDFGISTELRERWRGSRLNIEGRSWRTLPAPLPSVGAWLVSMDPYTYKLRGYKDDGYLYPTDWVRLWRLTGPLAADGRSGAAVVFCYGLRSAAKLPGGTLERFHEDGARFATEHALEIAAVELTAGGANRHVGLIFSRVPGLAEEAANQFRGLASNLAQRRSLDALTAGN